MVHAPIIAFMLKGGFNNTILLSAVLNKRNNLLTYFFLPVKSRTNEINNKINFYWTVLIIYASRFTSNSIKSFFFK